MFWGSLFRTHVILTPGACGREVSSRSDDTWSGWSGDEFHFFQNILFLQQMVNSVTPWTHPNLPLAQARPRRGSGRAWVSFGRVWRSCGRVWRSSINRPADVMLLEYYYIIILSYYYIIVLSYYYIIIL